MKRIGFDFQFVMLGIAVDHGEEFVLAAIVEAEPKSKAIRKRHFLLNGF